MVRPAAAANALPDAPRAAPSAVPAAPRDAQPPAATLTWRLVAYAAEMMCLESAGRLPLVDYRRATMYTTLSPCAMCAGAILHYQIPRCVIADSEHFQGEEARPI